MEQVKIKILDALQDAIIAVDETVKDDMLMIAFLSGTLCGKLYEAGKSDLAIKIEDLMTQVNNHNCP